MNPNAAIRDDRRRDGTSTLVLDRQDVEAHVDALVKSGARLADLFGSLDGEELVIRLVWALDGDDEYLVASWPARGTGYAPISAVAPAAFIEECEIYEQFGVRPGEGRPLNRLVIPPRAEHHFPRLGMGPPRDRPLPHAPHYVSGEAFEFPFGPVRGVGQESLYLGLVTSGEEVVDLYLLEWHKHRGIERRLVGEEPRNALFIAERAEGLSAVGNGWAFCRAVEAIAGVIPAQEVDRSRGVALELERLYNHAAAIAALCQATGLAVGQAQAEILFEQFLRLNAAVFGHRYLFGIVVPGGVERVPDVASLRAQLPPLMRRLDRLVSSLWATNSFVDRLESCGVIAPPDARRLGLVGPVARASGEDIDTRSDHSFGPYRQAVVEVATQQAGDVMARMTVMVQEMRESARLVLELVTEGVGAGTADVSALTGSALGWCESPRGESLMWVAMDGGRIRRARVRPGSARNWRAFDDAARSHNVFTDVPIIEASLWLTVAGLAR